MQMEFVFGQNGLSPIVLELGDGTFVYLQGRIDRVDVMTGGGLRVIDYKSGSRKFDPTLVYWGLQLQLLLYLAAALARVRVRTRRVFSIAGLPIRQCRPNHAFGKRWSVRSPKSWR